MGKSYVEFCPADNPNIVSAIDQVVKVYREEISNTTDLVHHHIVDEMNKMLTNKISIEHGLMRNDCSIDIGDNLTIATGSWQVRELKLEGKSVTVVGKTVDPWNREHYIVKSEGYPEFWISNEVARAIKTNTVDSFVYVASRAGDNLTILTF